MTQNPSITNIINNTKSFNNINIIKKDTKSFNNKYYK